MLRRLTSLYRREEADNRCDRRGIAEMSGMAKKMRCMWSKRVLDRRAKQLGTLNSLFLSSSCLFSCAIRFSCSGSSQITYLGFGSMEVEEPCSSRYSGSSSSRSSLLMYENALRNFAADIFRGIACSALLNLYISQVVEASRHTILSVLDQQAINT